MVQAHQDSCKEGRTKPIPPQETENIRHGSSEPQKFQQLHHREHPDWLHHCLVWQLLSFRPQGTTEGSISLVYHSINVQNNDIVTMNNYNIGAKLLAIQNLYTRLCQRKALKIVKDSSHPSHRLFSPLPHGKQYRSAKSRSKMLLNSFYPQAIKLLNTLSNGYPDYLHPPPTPRCCYSL